MVFGHELKKFICPTCGSDDTMKNGTTRRGKQNYKCRDCGRQFVEDPKWKPIDPDTKAIIDRLLLEKIPLAGIARVLQLSPDWLQQYVNAFYNAVPQRVQVQPKTKGRLALQMDELWSFVTAKGQQQWVWLALDVATREIVGCWIGDRSGTSALALWESMPGVYRQCATVYSDYWQAYSMVLPSQTIWYFTHHYNEMIRSEVSHC